MGRFAELLAHEGVEEEVVLGRFFIHLKIRCIMIFIKDPPYEISIIVLSSEHKIHYKLLWWLMTNQRNHGKNTINL